MTGLSHVDRGCGSTELQCCCVQLPVHPEGPRHDKKPTSMKANGNVHGELAPWERMHHQSPCLPFCSPVMEERSSGSAAGRGSPRDLKEPFTMIFEARCVLVHTEFD